MNVQRFKFAYARGARIEFKSATRPGWFEVPTDLIRELATCPFDIRIHPDDAHLEYGPLSSELRRRAIEGDFSEVQINYFAGITKYPLWEGMWAHFDLGDEVRWATGELARMHMLFVAEYLADEGL